MHVIGDKDDNIDSYLLILISREENNSHSFKTFPDFPFEGRMFLTYYVGNCEETL